MNAIENNFWTRRELLVMIFCEEEINAYVITEACIGIKDKACIEVCPVDCIYETPSSPQIYINPSECITCGGCVTRCPVGAIYDEGDVPDKWRHFIALNAAFFE